MKHYFGICRSPISQIHANQVWRGRLKIVEAEAAKKIKKDVAMRFLFDNLCVPFELKRFRTACLPTDN
jgi:hypothetical protein